MRINSRKPGRPKQYQDKRIPIQVYLDATIVEAWDKVRGKTSRRDEVERWLLARPEIQAAMSQKRME